jgi:hypothetical protein
MSLLSNKKAPRTLRRGDGHGPERRGTEKKDRPGKDTEPKTTARPEVKSIRGAWPFGGPLFWRG